MVFPVSSGAAIGDVIYRVNHIQRFRPGYDGWIERWRKLALLPLLAGVACAQSIEIYSEFQRPDPFGGIVRADRATRPREILSPAVPRNGHASFHIAVSVPGKESYLLYVATNPLDACRVTSIRNTSSELRMAGFRTASPSSIAFPISAPCPIRMMASRSRTRAFTFSTSGYHRIRARAASGWKCSLRWPAGASARSKCAWWKRAFRTCPTAIRGRSRRSGREPTRRRSRK